MAFNEDILDRTRRNHWFREVLATGPHAQVVVMSIPPGGEIGDVAAANIDGHAPAGHVQDGRVTSVADVALDA